MAISIQIQNEEWNVLISEITKVRNELGKGASYNDIIKCYQILVKKLNLQEKLTEALKDLLGETTKNETRRNKPKK